MGHGRSNLLLWSKYSDGRRKRRAGLASVLLAVLLMARVAAAASILVSPRGVSVPSALSVRSDSGAALDVGAALTLHATQIDELMKRTYDLQNNLTDALTLVQDQRQWMEQQGDRITQLESRITQQDQHIHQLQGNLSAALQVIEQHSTSIQQQGDTINDLSNWNHTVVERITTLEDNSGGNGGGGGGNNGNTGSPIPDSIDNALQMQGNSTIVTRVLSLESQLESLLTPQLVVADAGSNAATVRWTTQYAVVTAQPGGQQCSTEGIEHAGATECRVPGLDNGQAYSFSVQLFNKAGAGLPSPPTSPVTPQLRCVPFAVSGTGAGGSVTLQPPNSAHCGVGEFSPYEVVRMTAVPALEHKFGRWSGSGVSTSGSTANPLNLTLTDSVLDNDGVSVRFDVDLPCHPLSVAIAPNPIAGTVEFDPPQSVGCSVAGTFTRGSYVVITPKPAAARYFVQLTGGVLNSTANPTVLTMPDAPTDFTATFLPCFALTVTASNGPAPTRSPLKSPACPANGQYVAGERVALTATAPTGYTLTQWEYDNAPIGTDPLLVYTTTGAAVTLTAKLASCIRLNPYAPSAMGYVTRTPERSGTCDDSYYVAGTTVRMEAVPYNSSQFLFYRWANPSSITSSTANPVNYVTTAYSYSVTLDWTQLCFPLQLVVNQPGAANVSVSPPQSPGCPPSQYNKNAAVVLTVVVAPTFQWSWSRWERLPSTSGSFLSTTARSTTFTMPANNMQVTAVLLPCVPFTLVANPPGWGTTSIISGGANSPDCATGYYQPDTFLQIRAAATSTHFFDRWNGPTAKYFTNGTLLDQFPIEVPSGGGVFTATFGQCYELRTSELPSYMSGSSTLLPTSSSGCVGTNFYKLGAQVQVKSTALSCCKLDYYSWAGGAQTSTEVQFYVTATENVEEYVAHFVTK